MTIPSLPLTEHKRNMMRAWLDGKIIQIAHDNTWADWDRTRAPFFSSSDDKYRIKPEPKPKTYRWYTRDEFMALFAVWPSRFLVKGGEDVIAAALGLHETGHWIGLNNYSEIDGGNFKKFQYSHDGGKTWHPFGIEE